MSCWPISAMHLSRIAFPFRLSSRNYTLKTTLLMSLLVSPMLFLSVSSTSHSYSCSWVFISYSDCHFLGAIIGQVFVGLICDRIGRKVALIATTALIIIGATIGTAAHGANGNVQGLFWCLTFARGITGVVNTISSSCISEAFVEDLLPLGSRRRIPCFLHKC